MDQIQMLHKTFEETNKTVVPTIHAGEVIADVKAGDEITESVIKMLEMAEEMIENVTASMKKFRDVLVERNLLKGNFETIPQINVLSVHGGGKRDSGIASSVSSASPQTSSNRLSNYSGVDDDGPDVQNKVSFGLFSTTQSVDDFSEICESDAKESESTIYPKELSTVYIHLLPSDPRTDLSCLREKIYNLSCATMKSDYIQLHVVPSDSFIGIPSRQVSTSSDGQVSILRQSSTSSERISSFRAGLPSSSDSLNAGMLLINNLSAKTPEENSDHSDENNSRLVSSSESEISVARYRLQQQSTEHATQTDDPSEDNPNGVNLNEVFPSENNPTSGCQLQRRSVETQTD